jgi:hypothetical protein
MTKNKIIISNTNSRLLDNIKICSHNHFDYIDLYTVDIDEIFKAYDLIQPYKICICKQDLTKISVKTFIEQKIVEQSCLLIDEYNFLNVVNTDIFKAYKLPRTNKYAILLDNLDSIPEHIQNKLDSDECNIHMFNNPSINHNYNLGTLLEHQKAFIFATYAGIIGKNNLYKNEAILCGSKYIEIESTDMTENDILDQLITIDDFMKKEFYDTK